MQRATTDQQHHAFLQQKIRDGMQKTFAPGDEPLLQLPSAGVSADDLRKKLAFKVCLRLSTTRSTI